MCDNVYGFENEGKYLGRQKQLVDSEYKKVVSDEGLGDGENDTHKPINHL